MGKSSSCTEFSSVAEHTDRSKIYGKMNVAYLQRKIVSISGRELSSPSTCKLRPCTLCFIRSYTYDIYLHMYILCICICAHRHSLMCRDIFIYVYNEIKMSRKSFVSRGINKPCMTGVYITGVVYVKMSISRCNMIYNPLIRLFSSPFIRSV